MWNLPNASVCQNYALRDQHSFDFLVCEGLRGWSAVHTIYPFTLTIIIGTFLRSWVLTGVVEILEALAFSVFHSYVIFTTYDAEKETKAGSILGDWLINDLLGVLCACLLLYMLKLPGLTRGWRRASRDARKDEDDQHHHHTSSSPSCFDSPARRYQLKLFGLSVLLLLPSILGMYVSPADCGTKVEQDCTNIGFIIGTGIELLLILLCWRWFRTDQDQKYLWKPECVHRRRINALFFWWFVFVLVVGLQNAQPYWFLLNGSFVSTWTQVWMAEAFWVCTFLLYIWFYKAQLFEQKH